MNLEDDLLPYSQGRPARSTSKHNALKALCCLSLGAAGLYGGWCHLDKMDTHLDSLSVDYDAASACPFSEKLVPSPDSRYSNISYFRSAEYKKHSVDVWSGAISVYTPSFDDLGEVGVDPRWEVFFEYEDYLLKTFPHIKEASELVHVNTHGLVFIIHGTDESLKPVILMGHQDVVPVPPETAYRWSQPPYKGTFDGEFMWGRGSGDNKNDHIALMEGVDKLLADGFKTKRTIIISLGFDEEIHGFQGALPISRYLVERFGKDSIYFIVDEGFGVVDEYGSRFALPATGEKGYVDVIIDILTSGGHSSVPPRHTAIGIMSELVTLIESTMYGSDLTEKSPYFQELQCTAEKGKTMPKSLRKNVKKMGTSKSAKKKVLKTLEEQLQTRFLVSTSQAIDIVYGGLKINALPEKVTVRINHRVGYDSSVEEVKESILAKVKTVAKKYGLGVDGFDSAAVLADWPVDIPSGKFVLSTEKELAPAPQSPTSGPAWNVLAGTIKHVFEDFAIFPHAKPDTDPEVIVGPSIASGNTDTKHCWDLTRNIYRFSPGRIGTHANAHAVDEKVELDGHVEGVAFYYTLLRNLYEDDLRS